MLDNSKVINYNLEKSDSDKGGDNIAAIFDSNIIYYSRLKKEKGVVVSEKDRKVDVEVKVSSSFRFPRSRIILK